jgi:hypothetical protein
LDRKVLRIARNDAGHPTAVQLQREQVYVYLQLFVTFVRQAMQARQLLAGPERDGDEDNANAESLACCGEIPFVRYS